MDIFKFDSDDLIDACCFELQLICASFHGYETAFSFLLNSPDYWLFIEGLAYIPFEVMVQ